MPDLHAVPPEPEVPPVPDRRMTARRYRDIWKTLVVLFVIITALAFFHVLPPVAYATLTLFLLGCAAAATVKRSRQLKRNREEWGRWPG